MNDRDEMLVPPDLVYVTYIRATPQRVWQALTRGEDTQRYFFGFRIESDWRVGARWALYDGESVHDEGEVLECDPPRRLKISWRAVAFDDARELSPAFITYDIEPAGEAVKLTMTQHQPTPIPRKYIEGGEQGWPMILSSLKSLLETGDALVIKMEHPQ
ncbi:MAG: SRPBCC family protein [Vitreimonas sp.]